MEATYRISEDKVGLIKVKSEESILYVFFSSMKSTIFLPFLLKLTEQSRMFVALGVRFELFFFLLQLHVKYKLGNILR